jgi:hypothetical protein
MSDTPQQAKESAGAHAPEGAGGHGKDAATATGPKIHRVCISCNNMFVVPVDNYEAKHCSVCHKG